MTKRLATLVVVVVLSGQNAFGWNKAGHMVTGAIAYAALKQDSPGTISKVVALLEEHPDYQTVWDDLIHKPYVQPEDRELYLFMLAARWPDDARGGDYDEPSWHFVNKPYRVSGTATPQDEDPAEQNITTAFPQNLALAADTTESQEDRAVALCWVFHLAGDAHQPLHTTKLLSTTFPAPTGDRGGTRFWVKIKPSGNGVKLHQWWDGLVITSEKYQTARNKATELRNRPEFDKSQLTELSETNFDKWIDESFELAKSKVYLNGQLQQSATQAGAHLVPNGYVSDAKAVAERRVVVAGYRLADKLKAVLGP